MKLFSFVPPLVVAAYCCGFRAPAQSDGDPVNIRFTDSATGYTVEPDYVEARPHRPGDSAKHWGRGQFEKPGRATLMLARGRHTLTAVSAKHLPMTGEFEMSPDNPYQLDFYLDPVEEPEELRSEVIATLLRDDATLIQGFIADENTGGPLAGVRVSSFPSGANAETDGRGFFRFHVPVQSDTEATQVPAGLIFEKAGYGPVTRQHVELWPRGDWTYRIRMKPGDAAQVLDENMQRRRAPKPASDTAAWAAPGAPSAVEPPALAVVAPGTERPPLFSTASSNATVRVPRNIRVLKSDGVTIDYVTMDYYVKHVLPAEWIASWASYVGGSNSLNAGAVAIRCYAIAYVNSPRASTYDICGTTSCQVYGSATSSYCNTAVNYTADYVLINSSGTIPSTEYSAENNSVGYSCGDGYAQPNGGCLYDPACAGEARYGHGRGLCQWGSARWATGRKMAGRSSGDATANGYPRQDWKWIVQHYYPAYTLVKAAPLMVGDDIKSAYDTAIYVNQCADGGIAGGVNCPLLASLPAGVTGVIVDGPQLVTADGRGYTWYKVQWNNTGNTLGWTKENYLERIFSAPSLPVSLSATAVSGSRINLAWSDTTSVETGFRVERAPAPTGPWIELDTVAANVTSYSDIGLYPGSRWYYRVRAYNAGGNSGYSNIATATSPNTPVTLPAISNQSVTEGALLAFTNRATAGDFVQLLTDFENFTTETTNGLPLFRSPRYSPSTSGNLNATPDLTIVTDAYPTGGHGAGRALRVHCDFASVSNPWLRLTTAGAPAWPNPVIDFTKQLRFDVYTDRAVKIAIGCRETTTAAGTPLGSDGGTSGGIEWVGVTGVAGSAPVSSRVVLPNTWTTLTFDLPNEPCRSFSGGNGALSTASGLGVLEHLAVVPAAGTGVYSLYFDNFAVISPRTLTYSLGDGAPTNASINASTGEFNWTPTEAEGPATNTISVTVSDNSAPPVSATQTFTVVVGESNVEPALAAIPSFTVHAGTIITFTNTALDTDLPANTLTYALEADTPGLASVHPETGVFRWATGDGDVGTTNSFTVRVTDNGSPPLGDAVSFSVAVIAKPSIDGISTTAGSVTLTWRAIAGAGYRVQFKSDLNDPTWTDLMPDVIAGDAGAFFSDAPGMNQRFYRVLVLSP